MTSGLHRALARWLGPLALLAWAREFSWAQTAGSQVALSSSQCRVTRLAPGQTSATEAVVVDVCESITVHITSTRDDLSTRIVAPGGQIVDPTTVSNFGGVVSSFGGSAPDESTVIFAVKRPRRRWLSIRSYK